MSKEYDELTTPNAIYQANINTWNFLYDSYVGGEQYKRGEYLTRYHKESASEYNARIEATCLDNQCNSVVSLYTSFLFREQPVRELQGINPNIVEQVLWDADYEGRSLNNFMKEVATWSSVFGHTVIIVAKPDIGAVTMADEMASGVRPYLTLFSPTTVIDWAFERTPIGSFQLTYLKYYEDDNTIREWQPEVIRTYKIDNEDEEILETVEEINGLGLIPAVFAYNKRSNTRGVGVSDISDIAGAQKYVYNCYSELEQSVRMNTHPSLVARNGVDFNATGAGSVITVPDDIDSVNDAVKTVDYTGNDAQAVLSVIEKVSDAINKMSNTSGVRVTKTQAMSGVALEIDFQDLNTRLSEKADNLELAEEQIWELVSMYEGRTWSGSIYYPDSFGIKDIQNEITQLKLAQEVVTDESIQNDINNRIRELLGLNTSE